MITLRHYLDTTANGANQDWAVQYSTNAYDAVERSSADTTYIQSDTLNERSDFFCGDGPHPELGFVSAVTIHYRVRTTDTVGAPVVAIDILRSATPLAIGLSVNPTSSWVDGEYRLTSDPSTSARFLSAGLDDLGCMVKVTTAPTNGYVQVSRLWLEIEWTLSPEFYDPVYHGATPNSITGDMDWSNTGAQPHAIVGDQLVITDSSAADRRSYFRTIPALGENYTTEAASRLSLTSATIGFVYRIALVDDATAAVDLCCFSDSAGDPYIGLTTDGKDRDDPDDYFDTYALDWTEDHHYRMVIDRELDPGDSFGVKVYVDYEETPVLDVNYYKFDGTSGSPYMIFGTGDASLNSSVVTASIDFFDWWHYRKSGDNWRYWYATEIANNTVSVNSTDTAIARPVTITPPGITTGQSQYCCELGVQDLTDECSIRTYVPVPSSLGTYDLSLDYRIDTFAETAKLLVQRTSDFYYWNNGGSSWQAASTDITIPYAPTRTRSTLMTGITTSTPDKLIITVRNDTGAAATHNVYVYKVDLRD